MGTVEWSELLRWVPRGPQADSGEAFQTPDLCDVAAPAERACLGACDAAKIDPGELD